MAYALLDKELAKATTPINAYVGRVNGVNMDKLRLFEKDFIAIPWIEWLQIKEREGR